MCQSGKQPSPPTKSSKSLAVQTCFFSPTKLELSQAKHGNPLEWWRDSFATVAFAATELVAEIKYACATPQGGKLGLWLQMGLASLACDFTGTWGQSL